METKAATELKRLTIHLKNGKWTQYVGGDGAPVNVINKTLIKWCDWTINFYDDGSIRAKAHLYPMGTCRDEQTYVMFKITTSGHVGLYKKTPKEPEAINICTRKIPWPQDGTITLTSGNIEERHAFFTQEAYAELCKNCGLKGIKKGNPNGSYVIYKTKQSSRWVYTDGEIREIMQKEDGSRVVRVSKATWALVIRVADGEESRTLYTFRKVQELQSLLPMI